MRKAATILLLTVFCNSLFYYGYFSLSLLKAKLEAKLALAKIDPRVSADILRVPVSLLQKDGSDEVWYNEKLYDVIERDRINDTVYVFLERDEEEQDVLTRQQKYFLEKDGASTAAGHELTGVKMNRPISDTEPVSNFQRPWPRQVYLIKHIRAAGESSLAAFFAETPSPPPKPA